MAFTNIAASDTANQRKAAGTTITCQYVSGSGGTPSLSYRVAVIAKDNAATADGQTSEVTSVVDDAGNTYVKLGEFCNAQGAGNAGATVSVWSCRETNVTTTANIVTATFSSSITSAAISLAHFQVPSLAVAPRIEVVSLQTLANDAADAGSQAISGLPSLEYLFIRGVASEGLSVGFTATSGYAQFQPSGTSGGSAATNMSVDGEWDIATGTGSTSDPTIASSIDRASVFVALREVQNSLVVRAIHRLLPHLAR